MGSFCSQYSSAEGDILLHREGAMILCMHIKIWAKLMFGQATQYIWTSPLKFDIMLEHKWLIIMNLIYTMQNL